MSQKSSVPQAISFVSQVLKRDKFQVFTHGAPLLTRGTLLVDKDQCGCMDANPSKVVMFGEIGKMPVVPPPRSRAANPNVRPKQPLRRHSDRVAARRFRKRVRADNRRFPNVRRRGKPWSTAAGCLQMEEAMKPSE